MSRPSGYATPTRGKIRRKERAEYNRYLLLHSGRRKKGKSLTGNRCVIAGIFHSNREREIMLEILIFHFATFGKGKV